jgi:poly(3-hydroxybutyrate) depolymerase
MGAQLLGGLLLGLATAQPGMERDSPCPGCLTYVPERPGASASAPAPLLVALHGDRGSPESLAALLRPEAERRGWLLLVPRCPVAEGCREASWWRWAGPPAWLERQVDAVARAHPVDRARVYLFGWSGGASYVTLTSPRLPALFAAVGLAGGGMAPREPGCAPCPAPVLYLAGDRNPLHGLMVEARDALSACGHAVTWRPQRGLDHAGERAALERGGAAAILDFLAVQRRRCR